MIVLSVALALAAPIAQWVPGGGQAWINESGHEAANAIRLRRLASSGDVLAMRDYGLLLWKGQDVHRDRTAALGWFYEAALRNDPVSMFILGRAFERAKESAATSSLPITGPLAPSRTVTRTTAARQRARQSASSFPRSPWLG